jgi:peptidyl-prolyl cis-trans isomerase C
MTVTTGHTRARVQTRIVLAAATALIVSTGLALAQDPQPADRVVATVNGAAITESDLAIAARDLANDLAKFPPEQRQQVVLDSMIELKLFEQAAEKEGLDQKDVVKKRLAFLRGQALRNEYLLDKVVKVVTEDAVKKRYEEETAKFVPQDELHLEHILVQTEEQAKAIIAELDKGGDFAAIAKEKSLDTGSGASGGDLGFVARGVTVKPFEDAAFALEAGAYTKAPVQTQFGWHVIKLDEKRKQPAPTLEQRQNAIRQELLQSFLTSEIKALREAAKIDVAQIPAPAEKPADVPPADVAPTDAAPADAAPAKPAEDKPAQ